MKSIVVYGAKWCSYCKKLENWLVDNEHNYEFKDIDNEVNNQELNTYDAHGIPFIIIKDNDTKHTIEGFNPEQIKNVINSW